MIRPVISVIKETELPAKDGEINFPVPDAKYTKINDTEVYVVAMQNSEWVKFTKESEH